MVNVSRGPHASSSKLIALFLCIQLCVSIGLVLTSSAEKFELTDKIEVAGFNFLAAISVALLVLVVTGISRNINGHVRLFIFNLASLMSLLVYNTASTYLVQPILLTLNDSLSSGVYTVPNTAPVEEVSYVVDLLFFSEFHFQWLKNSSFLTSAVLGNYIWSKSRLKS